MFVALSILLALALGSLVPTHGVVMTGALGAIASVLLLASRPMLGIWLLIATIPLASLLSVGSVSLARVVGVGVVAAWLMRRLTHRISWRALASMAFVQICVLLLAYALVSSLWATYPNDTLVGLAQFALLTMMSVVVIDYATSWQNVHALARVLVLAGAAAALFVLEQYYVEGVRRAGGGVAGGINGTAATLVTIIPFAWHLLSVDPDRIWKWVGIGYLGVATLAVAVTFSRMSYLLLPVTLLVLVTRSRVYRGHGLAAFAAIAVAIILLPNTRIVERTQTIGPTLSQLFTTADGTPTRDSRRFHWAVGWAMFRDNPIGGAGFNNYGRLFRDRYQFSVGGSTGSNNVFGYGSVRDPHSSYLAFMATGGILGAILWGIFLLLTARYAVTSWRRVPRGAVAQRSLVEAVTVAAALQFLYGWTLTVHQDRLFWIVVALTVAVARLANRPQPVIASYPAHVAAA